MNYNLKHYAYIGDCVWELFIRKLVIQKTQSQNKMHNITIKYVCADFQAGLIKKLINDLASDEIDIVYRGRNIKMTINKKSNPKVHSLATSFEVLIGYLYLNKQTRLNEIFELLKPELKEIL